ncbi:hypothetical protein A2U01_0041256 [Trifolium medium]|uniref:Uncharacterized protein n=1 Tax=Trifolium medium TaxID=97028 RepID=A0A392QA11_9FABA|nr:hypothetical protein [Trifolium medium]
MRYSSKPMKGSMSVEASTPPLPPPSKRSVVLALKVKDCIKD